MACQCRQEFPLLRMLGLVCSMGMIKTMQNSFFPLGENKAPISRSFPVLTFFFFSFFLSDYFPSGSLCSFLKLIYGIFSVNRIHLVSLKLWFS